MKTERIFACLFVLSIALKQLHVAGAVLLLTSTLFGLSILYLLFGFYFFSDGGMRNQNLAVSIISGIMLSSAPLGILFCLQHWGGSKVLALSGAFLSIIPLVIALVLKTMSGDNTLNRYYNNMIIRSAILFVLNSIFYFIPAVAHASV